MAQTRGKHTATVSVHLGTTTTVLITRGRGRGPPRVRARWPARPQRHSPSGRPGSARPPPGTRRGTGSSRRGRRSRTRGCSARAGSCRRRCRWLSAPGGPRGGARAGGCRGEVGRWARRQCRWGAPWTPAGGMGAHGTELRTAPPAPGTPGPRELSQQHHPSPTLLSDLALGVRTPWIPTAQRRTWSEGGRVRARQRPHVCTDRRHLPTAATGRT